MKFYQAVMVLFSTTLTLAQISGVPSCSLQCFVNAMSHDGCSSLTDFACHCRKPALVSEVTPCVERACNERDQSSVSNAVVTECSSAGVPISIPPVGGTSTTARSQATGETSSPTNGPISPSGPVVTLPTSTPPVLPSNPMSAPSSVPTLPSLVDPSTPVTTSPPFLGGVETLRSGGRLAGAAAAMAAGYLV
ncbi:CFEM domain-containing protein [Aspergillus varians]